MSLSQILLSPRQLVEYECAPEFLQLQLRTRSDRRRSGDIFRFDMKNQPKPEQPEPPVVQQSSNCSNKWEDPLYLTNHFKTMACPKFVARTPCDYSKCHMYHGKKDRRRMFGIYHYTSHTCEHVKVGEDWKDPSKCPLKDECSKCHTRMEQQFHPEVYKKMKCKDLQTGPCPRAVFCAFAHNDQEIQGKRNPDWAFDWNKILPLGSHPNYNCNKKVSSRRSSITSESSHSSTELYKSRVETVRVECPKPEKLTFSFAAVAAGEKEKEKETISQNESVATISIQPQDPAVINSCDKNGELNLKNISLNEIQLDLSSNNPEVLPPYPVPGNPPPEYRPDAKEKHENEVNRFHNVSSLEDPPLVINTSGTASLPDISSVLSRNVTSSLEEMKKSSLTFAAVTKSKEKPQSSCSLPSLTEDVRSESPPNVMEGSVSSIARIASYADVVSVRCLDPDSNKSLEASFNYLALGPPPGFRALHGSGSGDMGSGVPNRDDILAELSMRMLMTEEKLKAEYGPQFQISLSTPVSKPTSEIRPCTEITKNNVVEWIPLEEYSTRNKIEDNAFAHCLECFRTGTPYT